MHLSHCTHLWAVGKQLAEAVGSMNWAEQGGLRASEELRQGEAEPQLEGALDHRWVA